MNRPASLISAMFLGLVALMHLMRLIFAVDVTVASFAVPMWMSGAAAIATGLLALWLIRERGSRGVS